MARRVGRDEEGKQLLQQVRLELRLVHRARRLHLHQRRQQQLRCALQWRREEALRVVVEAARREAEERGRQVRVHPALHLGLHARVGRVLDAPPRAPVNVRADDRLADVGERVRDELLLRVDVGPLAEEDARRQRATARLAVDADQQLIALEGRHLKRRVIEEGEHAAPIESRHLLVDGVDKRVRVPSGERLDAILFVRVKLGVKLEVLAADSHREGAVKRERVVERRHRPRHHPHRRADRRDVDLSKLAEDLAQALGRRAARVAEVGHQVGELHVLRAQRGLARGRDRARPLRIERQPRVQVARRVLELRAVEQRHHRERRLVLGVQLIENLEQRGALLGEPLAPLEEEEQRVHQALWQRAHPLRPVVRRHPQVGQLGLQKLEAVAAELPVCVLREREAHRQLLRHGGLDRLGERVEEIILRRQCRRAQHVAQDGRIVGQAQQLGKLLAEQLHLELVLLQLGVAEVDLFRQAAQQVHERRLAVQPQQVGNLRHRRLLVLLVQVDDEVPDLRKDDASERTKARGRHDNPARTPRAVDGRRERAFGGVSAASFGAARLLSKS
mmetsp:Transcript_21959/g.64930  ORF Transcript_21959/g.64930 Transcript_21959/m.64930 type:complete len:561 (+) Transcript_21959:476-2158(+)